MHGLVNRAIQCFLRDTYGQETWESIAHATGVGPQGFEPMLRYDDQLTHDLLQTACGELDKSRAMLLEDLGTYLVSHRNTQAIRRLLRFSGETFTEFLHSLDDLRDRARLAVSDLDMPVLQLRDGAPGRHHLHVSGNYDGYAWVMIGLLRALADDYGVLALIEMDDETTEGGHVIAMTIADAAFAEGRSFALARPDDGAVVSNASWG